MKVLWTVLAVLIVLVVVYGLVYWGTYNGLVANHEAANEGKARFAAAVNACSQKMKSVWALADQEGLLEKETYVGVAKARTAYEKAEKDFDAGKDDKSKSVLDLTKLGAGFGQAMINVRVAFEAYPQLRTTETYQKAMVAVEEGFNEIKTALDDWIGQCKAYNEHRRGLITNWFAKDWDQFPNSIAYYDGGIKEPEKTKVSADELNPKSKPAQ